MKKAVMQLETLTCPSCIKKIETVLSRQSGVQDAKVLFNASKVRVQYDDATVQANELKNTIVQLGYPVLDMKVS
jgi:copper chaperone